MNSDEQAAEHAIRDIFDHAVEDGLNPRYMSGATDDQIDAWAADQGVVSVPVAVREVLRLIGVNSGLWLAGSSFGVDSVREQSKRNALATLSKLDHSMNDATGSLVLVEHQSYEYHVVDGTDLTLPNPPVWLITEKESAGICWPSVDSWFKSDQPPIADYRFRLKLARKRNQSSTPSWLKYFNFEDTGEGRNP